MSGRRANGQGSIGPRDDGALIVRITDSTGDRHKRIVHRALRDDGRPETPAAHRRRSEQALTELRAHVARPAAERERWTVEKWATERYLPSVAESAKASTVVSYERHLATWVIPHVGAIELSKLTADDVDVLDRTLAARGLSLPTRRHARGALGRVLRHAIRKRRITTDVTAYADRLARDEHVDRTAGTLEPDEVRRLLAAATGGEWELPLALLGLLGLRRGELIGLAWEAVDLDAATLTVKRSMTVLPAGQVALDSPKTAGSRRTLNIGPQLVALLRQHRTRQAERQLAAGEHWCGSMADEAGQEVALVFVDEAGRPLPGHRINSALARIATAAGLARVNPHKLRHSAASVMLAGGMDPAAVGAVLGHASPAVTMSVYAHALGARKVAATDAIAAAVGDW